MRQQESLECSTLIQCKTLQSGAKILETWYLLPPSHLKQCCNNDSMPAGLLKWSTAQHYVWGEGGNKQ